MSATTRLLAVGQWLTVNGDAIYGTRPWKIYGEGPTAVKAGSFHDTQPYTAQDFRFTTKGSDLFAIDLGWPEKGEAVIHALGTSGLPGQHIQNISLLGSEAKLSYEQEADGLHIKLPEKQPDGPAYAFRIGLDSAAQTDPKYK